MHPRRITLCALLLAACAAAPTSPDVHLRFFGAERASEDVPLGRQTKAERGAQDVEPHRTSAGAPPLLPVATLPAHSPGKPYAWGAWRTSLGVAEPSGAEDAQAGYGLEVAFQDDGRQALPPKPDGQVPLALRRAWSSIKAMLQ